MLCHCNVCAYAHIHARAGRLCVYGFMNYETIHAHWTNYEILIMLAVLVPDSDIAFWFSTMDAAPTMDANVVGMAAAIPPGELQIVVSPQRPLLFEEYAERVHATFEIGFVKELIYIKLGIAEMVQDISCHGRLLDDELQLAECHVQSGDVLRVSLKAARVDASVVSDPASKKRRIDTPALSQIKKRCDDEEKQRRGLSHLQEWDSFALPGII